MRSPLFAVDVLVNNAGTAHSGLVESYKQPQEFTSVMVGRLPAGWMTGHMPAGRMNGHMPAGRMKGSESRPCRVKAQVTADADCPGPAKGTI